MSDPAGAICGVPVKSNLFIVEHPVPTHAIIRFIRSALMALIVIHEPFRPSEADLRRIVCQHNHTAETARHFGLNMSVPNTVCCIPIGSTASSARRSD